MCERAFDGIVASVMGNSALKSTEVAEGFRIRGPLRSAWAGRWYVVPLAIFVVSRLVDTVILALASRRQVALPASRQDYHVFFPTPASPGYQGIVANWDGQWYARLATFGYQTPAPGAPHAGEALWAWAFPPVYPLLVRGLMELFSLSFITAATIVSVVSGAGAMVLMYGLVLRYAGKFLAICTVTLSSFFVSAPLLQIAYAESLALLLLMAALNLLATRRYGWAATCVVVLSFTRIVTLPLVAVVVAHAWVRWRSEGPFWRTDRRGALQLGVVGVAALVGTVLWMLVASLFIGLSAGTRRSEEQRTLFQGWFRDLYQLFGLGGLLLLLVFLVLLALTLLTPRGRVWGPELRAWSLAYPVYLFWFTPLLPAVMRYLLLVPTLPVVLTGLPQRRNTAAVVALGVVVLGLVAVQYWYAGNIIVVFTTELRPGP